jgi:hypothetical protein
VLETLRSDERFGAWLRVLEASDAPQVEVRLPEADDLPAALLDLAVPHPDINELVAVRDAVLGHPESRWLLERTVSWLVSRLGTIEEHPRLAQPPQSWGAVGRLFYVYAFVATAPYTRAYHESRGIPPEATRRTLADLGRNVAVHRRRYGTGGLVHPIWLTLHYCGTVYQLGRLQFERATLGRRTGQAVGAAGLPLGPGSPSLELHIPDFQGPLSPPACDRSLRLAREFFPRHFPEERYTVAACHSWLLDSQLRRYLPPDSNIVRFQDRFRTAYTSDKVYDHDTVAFVFGDPDLPLDSMPRDSTLQRAVADHLRSGGHWYAGHGWFEL